MTCHALLSSCKNLVKIWTHNSFGRRYCEFGAVYLAGTFHASNYWIYSVSAVSAMWGPYTGSGVPLDPQLIPYTCIRVNRVSHTYILLCYSYIIGFFTFSQTSPYSLLLFVCDFDCTNCISWKYSSMAVHILITSMPFLISVWIGFSAYLVYITTMYTGAKCTVVLFLSNLTPLPRTVH